MKQKLISIALTVLLGPGAGHIYLRKYRRGIMFVLSTLFFAGLFAVMIARATPDITAAAQNPSELLKNFYLNYPNTTFIYDAIFAAIWAYALLDCFMIAKTLTKPAADTGLENQ